MIIRVYFEYCHELETNPFLAHANINEQQIVPA